MEHKVTKLNFQAYSNFGKRVKSIQAKLVEDRLPSLKIETKQSLLAAADLSSHANPAFSVTRAQVSLPARTRNDKVALVAVIRRSPQGSGQ